MKNFDITIIGGSFSGMALGLALTQISTDLKIAIIEKIDIKNQDRKNDGKNYAISNKTLKFFKEIDIFDKAIKDSSVIKNIKITDYKSPIFVDFLSKEVDEKDFGALIQSHIIHNSLRDEILKQKNIEVFAPNSYQEIEFDEDFIKNNEGATNSGAIITLDNGEKILTKLLIACDGRFSKLREKFDIETKVKNFKQKAIVFNIKHQKPHENIAWEKFIEGGPIAILPLANQNQSSIVWILQEDFAKTIFELDDENFIQQLNKKMENCLGKIEIISEKFSYPLTMIEAKKFYYKKMILVGDAACGVHPIAGQGLNLGFESIKILQELIAENYLCGLEINSQILMENYNKRAKFNAKKMALATDLLNSLFESESLTLKFARNFGLAITQKIPSLKKIFIKNAGGL